MRKIIGHFRRARAAFTLMEVNLAVFIMAMGVLAMAALYPLGFRESQQSRDDIVAAITADEVLGQLSAALSSRDIKWNTWRDKVGAAVKESNNGGAGNGWLSYFTKVNSNKFVVRSSDVNSRAEKVFAALADVAGKPKPKWRPNEGQDKKDKYAHGLVVQWGKRIVDGKDEDDYSRVSISFRMSRRPGALMSAPLYYTEVHFQGDYGDEKDTE